jgi:hypothetical protein
MLIWVLEKLNCDGTECIQVAHNSPVVGSCVPVDEQLVSKKGGDFF